jgi:hypothetical protein
MAMKRIVVRGIASGLALVALLVIVMAAAAQQSRDQKRAEFMRMKLEHSKKILEGLTLENYGTIAKSAKALKRLSEAAEWEAPTIPKVPDYLVYTTEFQRITDDLSEKAEAKNIDGATLAYLRLTMNCVNCHKYVRHPTR